MHNSAHHGNIPVMTPRLRTLIDQVSRQAEADAVLLRRFAADRDPQAFAELVRRYGRLVWGQCRNLLQREADADDAFQATFLALAKSAKAIRDKNKLGPWLHGVAYRVCQQLHRTAARRAKREKATAKSETVRPVADSAWDQAFASVHDELAQLPDTLRAPFVLCVFEGKGVTEAAAQLGLKLGTFSARLSRAKQTLFERLSARGLTAGLAAVGAVAVVASNVPAAVANKTCDLVAGGTVPANILSLSHGVLGMVTMSAKRWTMVVMAAGGLALGMGGVWTANAQEKPKELPLEEKKRLLDDLKKKIEADEAKLRDQENLHRKQIEEAKKQLEEAVRKSKAEGDHADLGKVIEKVVQKDKEPKAPEFLYFGQKAGFAPTSAEFEETVKGVEAKGYTFVGVMSMKGQTKTKDGEAVPTLVFRRSSGSLTNKLGSIVDDIKLPSKLGSIVDDKLPNKLGTIADDIKKGAMAKEKELQAEIDRLKQELTKLAQGKLDPKPLKEVKPDQKPEPKPLKEVRPDSVPMPLKEVRPDQKPKLEPKPNVDQPKLESKPKFDLPKLDPKPKSDAKLTDAAIMTVSLKQLGGDYDAGVKLLTGMARLKFGEKAADGLTFGKKEGTVTIAGDEKVLAWLSEAVKILSADKK